MIMKSSQIISIFSAMLASSFGYMYETTQFFDPEDVGMAHTEVIHDLHQRMREQPPSNKDEYLDHMLDAIVDYMCDPVTEQCIDRIFETFDNIDMTYSSGFEHVSKNLVPKDFDAIVLDSMEKLFKSISLLSWDESPKEILEEMFVNFEDLRDNEEVEDDRHRMVGLVAYSVGMESAKQWHEILNEPDNQFHKLITIQKEINQRRLQDELLGGLSPSDILTNVQAGAVNDLDPIDLVEADVVGSAAGAIMGGFDVVEGENSTLLEVVAESAILYSATNIVEQFAAPNEGGGLIDNIVGGVTNNNGTGIFSGITNAITGNDNNNNSTGGGILSNILGGNNNNNNNNSTDGENEDGGFFSNLVGGITGNNNNLVNDNVTTGVGGNNIDGGNAVSEGDSSSTNNGGSGEGEGSGTGIGGAIGSAIGGFLGNNNGEEENSPNGENNGEGSGNGIFAGVANLFGGGGNNAASRLDNGV